jgi:hypothetical protein
MKLTRWLTCLAVLVLGAKVARADSASFTGTLSSPETPFEVILSLPSTATIGLQTYGFGGGTNAAGTVILPGGTDPFLAIFAGTGPGATILTDGTPPPFGPNPFGTSLDLSNYGSFVGCPPAGTPTIGGSPTCGDVAMTLSSLAPGDYTVVLSDGQYQANAVFDNGTLGEDFTDFTGGIFCNLLINGVDCPNTSGAFALDITGLPEGSTASQVPEPGTLPLLGTGLAALGFLYRRRRFAPEVETI